MANPLIFMPIDDAARDGKGHLVKTADGQHHAASYVGGTWCYSGDTTHPVRGDVTEYCTRMAPAEVA